MKRPSGDQVGCAWSPSSNVTRTSALGALGSATPAGEPRLDQAR